MELHPLLTASLRNPITKKSDVPPLEPPPLPPGWTAVNPGKDRSRLCGGGGGFVTLYSWAQLASMCSRSLSSSEISPF